MDSAAGVNTDQSAALRDAIDKCVNLGRMASSADNEEYAQLEREILSAIEAKKPEMSEALFSCSTSASVGAEALTRLFLRCGNDSRLEQRIGDCVRLARDHNRQALYMLSALAAACIPNGAAVHKASQGLQHLSQQNPSKRSEIAQSLAQAYKEYSDQGKLLSTMALIASSEPDGVPPMLALSCLSDAFSSACRSNNHALKERSLKGYLTLAPLLRTPDAELIADNMAESLLPFLHSAAQQLSQRNIELLVDRFNSKLDDADIQLPERTLFVKGLLAVSKQFSAVELAALAENRLQAGDVELAEHIVERIEPLSAKGQLSSAEEIQLLERRLLIHLKAGSTYKANRCRKQLAAVYQRHYADAPVQAAESLMSLAEAAANAKDWLDVERYAKLALNIRKRIKPLNIDQVVACMELVSIASRKQGNEVAAERWLSKVEILRNSPLGEDEIERALNTYAQLPDEINLVLMPEGVSLETNDFPLLIKQTNGLDLHIYFDDALRQAPALSDAEKRELSDDLFDLFDSVKAFSSNLEGVTMHRTEDSTVSLPPGLTQGIVQQMLVSADVKFRFVPELPDTVHFVDISGIKLKVGERLLALAELRLKATALTDKQRDDLARAALLAPAVAGRTEPLPVPDCRCVVTPVFRDEGGGTDLVKHQFSFASLANKGRELLAGAVVRMGNIKIDLPIIEEEFYLCARDAANFKDVLHFAEKDLLSFVERTARIEISEPIFKAMMAGCHHIVKNRDVITLNRAVASECDLGGVVIRFAPSLQMHVAPHDHDLNIEQISGLGVEVPFDAPPELHAIGLDLKKSLPTSMTSLLIGAVSDEGHRKFVAGTGPSCWIAIDMTEDMQPVLDSNNNWRLYGVTSNPITGNPQRFYVRLDSANRVAMTHQEIADLVSQTVMVGFDVSDPSTWKWGAVAIGGQTIATAGDILKQAKEEAESVKKYARRIGQLFKGLIGDP